MTGGTRTEYAALTHPGRVRSNNEDALCVRAEDGLFVVADGMGGHEHGEWASATIADALRAVTLPADFDGAHRAVAAAMHRANAAIYAEAQARGKQMGSTAVVLLVRDGQFAVLWVGDSRAYLQREGQLVRISHDHTQVQEMIDRGLLAPDQAEGHPMSHVLARAMGVRDVVEIDVIADEVAGDDVFLLCSDGLMARVDDAEIAAVLADPDPATRAETLVARTLDRGAPDNVTVVTINVQPSTMLDLNQPITMVAR